MGKEKGADDNKDRGGSYTTYKGEQVKAVIWYSMSLVGYRCRERVNAEEQERIFNDFYALASHDTQNKYLYGLIHKEPVKRQTTRPQSLKYRRHTLTYHVPCKMELRCRFVRKHSAICMQLASVG